MSIPVNTGSSEATTYITAITCDQMKEAEDYLLEYILAWLDTAIDDDRNALDVSLGLLRTIQKVLTFNNVQECFDYLSSITEKRAFLVLSCTIDLQLLDRFLVLPQLEYIYVFGEEAILKKEHSKLVEVTSIQKLYSRLSRDFHSSCEEVDDADFASLESNSTEKSIRVSEGDARIFIFYQVLIEILLHLPKTAAIKERFISFCMEKTNNKSAQQMTFQEFIESYKPEKAIQWYTRPCFLHKLLNRTCRLGNIKDMFKLAYFMTDLHAQLKGLHNEYFDLYNEEVEVYRGRLMYTTQFEKLKASIGDLVVTKSFLSTTTKRDVARMYSGSGTTASNVVPAVLHMKINRRRHEAKPFAFIRYESSVPADDEILLSIGMIFRVTGEKCEDGIHEFMLVRGDAEKQIEEEMESTFCNQTIGRDAFSRLDESTDTDECCTQVLTVLTSSDDPTAERLEEDPSSESSEMINTGPETTTASSVQCQIPIPEHRFKRISREVQKLKEITNLFILDTGPVFDTSLVSSGSSAASPSYSTRNIIIDGRILPTSEPYCQRSCRVRFILPPQYPFEPPNLRFVDPIYHVNINKAGKICNTMLDAYAGYNPTVSLSDIIISTEQLISNPNLNLHYVINIQAGEDYQNNRNEFNRKALALVLQHGYPRT